MNKYRADPSSLGDYLMNEIKNITLTNKNNKEIPIYKGTYTLSVKDELFIQVSNSLKTLDPLPPLKFVEELYLLPADSNLKNKNATAEEKAKAQKEKQIEDKANFKKLKSSFGEKFPKIKIFRHNMMNNDVEDSIVMQILTNFNGENKTNERFFDFIFNENINYIGVSLAGKKAKKEGFIILA
jgi:hypothetical protein